MILVSSANNIGILLSFMVLGKSLTYMRNNSGPKTKPWGTPSVIFFHAEKLVWFDPSFVIWTLVYLFWRQDTNHDLVMPFTPWNWSFDSKISWFKQSKAFSKSKK